MKIGTATVTESRGVNLPPGTRAFVTVPVPPSTNNLFATVRGKRVKTREYRTWINRVLPLFRELARPELPCRVHLTIDGEVNESRDGDNFLKPICDALVEAQVIPDDSLRYVHGGSWIRRDKAGAPTVTVWLIGEPDTAAPLPPASGSRGRTTER